MIAVICFLVCISSGSSNDGEYPIEHQDIDESAIYFVEFEGYCISATVNGENILPRCNALLHLAFENGRVVYIFALGGGKGRGDVVAFSGGFDMYIMEDFYWAEIDMIRTEEEDFKVEGNCIMDGNLHEGGIFSCDASSPEGKKEFRASFQYRIDGVKQFVKGKGL